MRSKLSDYEWTAIEPMLSNEPRGIDASIVPCIGTEPVSQTTIILAGPLRAWRQLGDR